MAKEKKKMLPEDKKIARRRVYATERLKHLTEEVKALKTVLTGQKAASKDRKTEPSRQERRTHIYRLMRMQALREERAGLREELKSQRGAKPEAKA